MKYDTPYKEQWSRIKRLREDIKRFAVASDENFEMAIDAFTSFFIQCYHLRDWLIKSGFDKNKVDQYVLNNKYLNLCRDLANKQKHQKITRYKPKNSFVDHGFGISTPITRHFDYFIHRGPRFGINVWENGISVDVIDVANETVKAWEIFLQEYSPNNIRL